MSVLSTISNNNDWYLLTADFDAYIKAQEQVILIYLTFLDWHWMEEFVRMDEEIDL